MHTLALVSALLAEPAAAQAVGDFVISPDILLEANSNGSGYMVNGVGAPAVAWDPDRGRYIMVFEVKLPASDPACPAGMWGLGIATSTDATTGWLTAADPLLEPAAGTFYACVAAHPGVMYSSATRTLHVFFKAEQTDPPDLAVGPSRYTGVGHLTVKFRSNGTIASITVDPTPSLQIDQNFGMPKVIRVAGQLEMMLTILPDAWMATAPPGSTTFTLDAAPIMGPDPGLTWATDELFNAALLCDDDPVYPWAAFIGGKNTGVGGTILEAGWSKAVSSDGNTWLLGVDPYFTWSGDTEWRHWDVLRLDDPGGTEYLMWFDEKDAAGLNRVRFASTIDVWDPADIHSRDCP